MTPLEYAELDAAFARAEGLAGSLWNSGGRSPMECWIKPTNGGDYYRYPAHANWSIVMPVAVREQILIVCKPKLARVWSTRDPDVEALESLSDHPDPDTAVRVAIMRTPYRDE